MNNKLIKKASFTDNCPSYENLNAYVEMQLNSKDDEILEQRLSQCKQEVCVCQNMIDGLYVMKEAEALEKNDGKQPLSPRKNEGTQRTLKRRVFAVAATVLICIIGSIIISNEISSVKVQEPILTHEVQPDSPENQETSPVAETSTEEYKEEKQVQEDQLNPAEAVEEPTEMIAQNQSSYPINKEWEARIIDQNRSSIRGDQEFEITPSITETDLKFTWKLDSPRPVSVVIYDYQDNAKFESNDIEAGVQSLLVPIEEWPSGIYYYQANDLENETFLLGKISINKK